MPDVVVVGAGVMGASIALETQRAGLSTLVVDKGDAVGGGSTSASSAVVRFSYSTLAGVTAAWESRHRWERWTNHLGLATSRDGAPHARFHRVGMLFIEPPGFDRRAFLDNLEIVGVPFEVVDADDIAGLYPALDASRFWPPRLPDDERFFDDPDGRVCGWLSPEAGFIDDPQLAALNLMDAARRHGAELRLRTTVVGVERNGGRVAGIRTADGSTIDSPVVVNAAGPWSPQLNRLAGIEADMAITNRPLRQEVHAVGAPPGFGYGDGGTMVADLDLGYYTLPQPGGSLLVGGIEADCDPLVWIGDPDADEPTPTVSVWEAQVWRLARRLPSLEIPLRPVGLAGHYDVTPDWVPIYDRTSLDGFYLAIGTSGNQFKNAPLVGQIMCDLITACEGGHDHDADPVRVDCHHTGRTLDLGAFSRNRTPATTTGTVLG